MKPSITLFIAVALMLTFNACKHDEDDIPVPAAAAPAYESYSNLKVGNYWIYQLFTVDSLGVFSASTDYDSCYVEKDTLIHADTFHKLVKISSLGWPVSSIVLLRDSLSYVVDQLGVVCFSSTDFTSTFNASSYLIGTDTVYDQSSKMYNETNAAIPLGAFEVLNFKTSYIMHPPYSAGGYRRYINRRYCKNIGLVSETLNFFAGIPTYKERRLVRYHVNP